MTPPKVFGDEVIEAARRIVASLTFPPKRPTIAELEEILSQPDAPPVHIKPDGTIGVGESDSLIVARSLLSAVEECEKELRCDAGAVALPALEAWRPMASAPRDGTDILLRFKSRRCAIAWGNHHDLIWADASDDSELPDPVAWQPLPAPEQESSADERDGSGREAQADRVATTPTPIEQGQSEAGGWRSMDSAPKDGTEIWAYTTEGYQRVVRWQKDLGPSSDDPGHDAGWASDCGGTYPGCFYHEPQPPHDPPLRWMPLPASPDLEQDAEDAGPPSHEVASTTHTSRSLKLEEEERG